MLYYEVYPVPIKQAKGSKFKADQLCRQILLAQHDQCGRCGASDRHAQLQVSHIISRRYSATRTDLSNLQILCARCHIYLTAWPREFSHWITQSIGSEEYDRLKLKAEAVTKVNWDDELDRLRTLYAKL